MLYKQFTRFLHTGKYFYAANVGSSSNLAVLRKKTGYTFSNCKKALELHNNDLNKAEGWLKQQAQSLGWSKATKLEGRSTKQGLVSVSVQSNIGALVEINCETDFVAKNESFQKFVKNVSRACLNHAKEMKDNDSILKVLLHNEELKKILLEDGKTLADHLALMIGTVGENATLRRAICFKTSNSISLAGYAHPAPSNDSSIDGPFLGKYGAIVAFKENNETNFEIPKKLCQHILGMNPIKIGDKNTDKPSENKDDEICLIHQEYLMDPDITVGEFLNENNIEVLDFERFECGENLNENINLEKAVN